MIPLNSVILIVCSKQEYDSVFCYTLRTKFTNDTHVRRFDTGQTEQAIRCKVERTPFKPLSQDNRSFPKIIFFERYWKALKSLESLHQHVDNLVWAIYGSPLDINLWVDRSKTSSGISCILQTAAKCRSVQANILLYIEDQRFRLGKQKWDDVFSSINKRSHFTRYDTWNETMGNKYYKLYCFITLRIYLWSTLVLPLRLIYHHL